jgi:hypothetical protein
MAKKKTPKIEYDLSESSFNVTIPEQFKGYMDMLNEFYQFKPFNVYDVAKNFQGVGTHDDIKLMLEFLYSIGMLAKQEVSGKAMYAITPDSLTLERINAAVEYLEGHLKTLNAFKQEILSRYEIKAE